MAKQKNSNKGWIIGTVLGAIGGAAYALWKTPMSGQQLRGKLAPGSASHTAATSSSGFTNTVMDKVEHTLAPIVGVRLGHTANKTGDAESVKVSQTTVYSADTAAAGGTTVTNESDKQRFAWGAPAPDRNVVEDPKFEAAETARVEPNLPEVAPETENDPVVASSSNATPEYGATSIRARRFGWGDPAPEMATVPPATEFSNVPSAGSVMPEQAPAGAAVSPPTDDTFVNTTGTAGINPEHSTHGTGLTTPSPEQRVVPSSPSDVTAPIGTDHDVDDAVLRAASGHSTGKMNPFPNLGGLED